MFFPICNSGDIFIVVLDFKRKVNVVLDTKSSLEDEPSTVKYGAIPTNVVIWISCPFKSCCLNSLIVGLINDFYLTLHIIILVFIL